MPKFGMVIDLEKCTACQACVVACAVENNLPPGNINDAQMNRIIRWLKILPISDAKSGIFKMTLIPFTCQQCSRPPCTYVCPVSATYKNPDGIIAQVYWRCIGCRYCVDACPSRAIVFGNMEDAQSKVAELSHSPRAFRFLEELGTSPNITYLKEIK